MTALIDVIHVPTQHMMSYSGLNEPLWIQLWRDPSRLSGSNGTLNRKLSGPVRRP